MDFVLLDESSLALQLRFQAFAEPSQPTDSSLTHKLARVDALGAKIRDMKAQKSPNDIISSLVSEMNTLKSDLVAPLLDAIGDLEAKLEVVGPHSSSQEAEAMRLCNMLPPSHKKKVEKRLKAGRKSRESALLAEKRKLFDQKRHTTGLRVQRKIHHLLASEGRGDDFFYNLELSPRHEIRHSSTVFLTEKWDGTTAQATNKGIFKRMDRFSVGDARKHDAPESERYDIERLDIPLSKTNGTGVPAAERDSDGDGSTLDESHRYLRRAVEPYLEAFANLPDGLCVYFEVCGVNIQARYNRGAPLEDWYDIRVFDFARFGIFLPWLETVELAAEHKLPVVGHTGPAKLDLPALLATLASEPRYVSALESGHPAGSALLEGYVVRGVAEPRHASSSAEDEDPVAKIRVADLENISKTRGC